MHMAAYRALGLDHEYESVQVLDVGAEIGAIRRFDGINVTVPHKEAILAYCHPDDFARRAGSANTVNWITGEAINTDGPGFLDLLPKDVRRVLILGAGGTSRALTLALALAGIEVSLWNRTRERAEQLIRDLDVPAKVCSRPDLSGQEAIVNATPTGLTGEPLPVDWGKAERDALAFELSYGAVPSEFELAAERAGLEVIGGRELLIAQGARSFEWWLGQPAPREAMREAVYGKGSELRNHDH
jgi:shikimate dehydrogenase